jgi:hypothetical protein
MLHPVARSVLDMRKPSICHSWLHAAITGRCLQVSDVSLQPAKDGLSFQVTVHAAVPPVSWTDLVHRCLPGKRFLRLGDLRADSEQGAPGPTGPLPVGDRLLPADRLGCPLPGLD